MSYEKESLRLILILSSNDFNCLPNLNLFRHIGFTIYPMRKMSLYIKWFNRIDCNAWCIPKKKKSTQPKIAILTVSLFRTQFKIQQYSKWLLRSTVRQAENEVGTSLVIHQNQDKCFRWTANFSIGYTRRDGFSNGQHSTKYTDHKYTFIRLIDSYHSTWNRKINRDTRIVKYKRQINFISMMIFFSVSFKIRNIKKTHRHHLIHTKYRPDSMFLRHMKVH